MSRQINIHEAGMYRMQAMLEQLLRLHCEMYAHLAKKDFQEIFDHVLEEVDAATKELIEMHSNLGGEATGEN